MLYFVFQKFCSVVFCSCHTCKVCMDEMSKRPVFGNRLLTEEANVFQHNAWDNVQWTEEQEGEAKAIILKQLENRISDCDQVTILSDASRFWDKFYDKHENKFFKDRHWLFTEFPELRCDQCGDSELKTSKNLSVETTGEFPGKDSEFRCFELGCGVGNTIFPVLQVNKDRNFFMYGCDYSETAINIIKTNKEYDSKRCHVFVYDITTDQVLPFPAESLDLIVMIFVLSALEFKKTRAAIKHVIKYLKPGGMILFRDYGRYDMAQLRFKKGRCLSENFYTRGDGTLVYFFTQDEVRNLFTEAGLVEVQNIVDRRLQVNRARQVKMYRVWVQGKYRKPLLVKS